MPAYALFARQLVCNAKTIWANILCQSNSLKTGSARIKRTKMTSRPKVLTSFRDEQHGVSKMFVDVIEKHFDIVYVKEFWEDPKKYEDIVGILTWPSLPASISKEWLDVLPNLKIIAAVGVGYNHLDVPLIRSYGVKVSNTPDVLSASTAEMGMTLMLAAARNLVNVVVENKAPDFKRNPVNDMTQEVSGSTLGIVGMGRIGFYVAKQARGFDMKILYHNRNRRPKSEEAEVGATYYSNLNEMLPLCDFVMVVVCLTEQTRHIISTEQFKKMKNSAILVNISRGGTINQEALVHALKTGEIHSAALDVTYPEPLPRDHELLKLKNVIISPHCGSQTRKTRERMIKLAVDNVLAAVNGTKLPSEVFE